MEEKMEKVSPRKEIRGFDPRQLYENGGFNFGEGELVIGGNTKEVLGRMTACLLLAHDLNGKPIFRGVTVIAPPRLVWDVADEDILEMVVRGANDLRYEQVDAEERAVLQKLLKVHRCEHLDAREVLEAVESVGPRQLLLIPEASKYRDRNVVTEPPVGRTAVAIREDQWVPHLTNLATRAIKTAKENDEFLVFSANEEAPTRESNERALANIDGLYTTYLKYLGEKGAGEPVLASIEKWVALATSGRVKQAFAELEDSDIAPDYKAQLAVQLASRSGDDELAVRTLRTALAKGITFPAEMAARFGRISQLCGDEDTARSLLNQSVDKVTDQALLEAVLMSCTNMNDGQLFDRVWGRLNSLFPDSAVLQDNCKVRLMRLCQLVPGTEELPHPSRAGFSDFHNHVADTLSGKTIADYKVLLDRVENEWKEYIKLAALCAGLHAQASKDPINAFVLGELAVDDERYEVQAVRLMLSAMRHVMLMELIPRDNLKLYKLPLTHIVRCLASHPEIDQLRSALSSTLSVESAGVVGLPILASLTLDLVGQGTELMSAQPLPPRSTDQEIQEFFKKALPWMADQSVVELGVTKLPRELAGNNPTGLIQGLRSILRVASLRHEGVENLHFIERCAYLVCLLKPYAPHGDPDLDALRLLAAKCWIQGKSQQARDLAEEILKLGSDTPQRKRIAWGSYADIYQRMQNPIEALIGIACAASCDVKVEPADLFQEAYTLLRTARDLHLYKVAWSILPACRNLCEMQNLGESGRLRLDDIELGLRLAEVSKDDRAAIGKLVDDARSHCEKVLASGDEVIPAASCFAQAVGFYERAGGDLSNDAIKLLEILYEKVGTETAAFVRAVSAVAPTTEDLVMLHNRLETARYSEDVASDQVSVVIAARRLLLPRTIELESMEAALAIELLAEQSIELSLHVEPLKAEWPCDYLVKLSSEGIGILMLGLDEQGELLALIADNGILENKRPEKQDSSFLERLDSWSADYPYRYGLIERDDGNGEFFATMQQFTIPLPSSPQFMVVAEPALQQLPFNLMLEAGGFVGDSKSIGLVPSLTWFDAMRNQPSGKDGRRVAWISTSQDAEVFGTLEMIFARLQPIFEQHGFATDTSGKIPTNLRGAQMAVVTAHGQLTKEARYIHRIADEQALAESPAALARALKDVELVILFVCSGGRVDRHPLSNTAVSLPRMLLDRGCRTVIASPWPLAAVVTGNWFERFMKEWEAGASAIEANFKANQHVRERLGPEPQYSLAMTVYGDLMLRKKTHL